jgi:hypothetical protein
MDWPEIRRQVSRQAQQYADDFRNLWEALQHVEGWTGLLLILAAIFVVAEWFITGLGFDRLNGVVGFLGGAWRPRMCRPMSNGAGVFVILDAVVMAFCAAIAIGEMLLLRERIRKRRPVNSRAVVTASLSMLISGITGIVFMRSIC